MMAIIIIVVTLLLIFGGGRLDGSRTTTATSLLLSSAFLHTSLSFSYLPLPLSRTTTHGHNHNGHPTNNVLFSAPDEDDGGSSKVVDDDAVCGNGFYKKSGPHGDYCVLDYDAVAPETLVVEGSESDYWDALHKQNASRKKFGLKPLTPSQYVALQAQNHQIEMRNVADAAAKIFDEFDQNGDGVVSLSELHEGLERVLEVRERIPRDRIERVMKHFDESGDGSLRPHEFVTLERFRSKLDALAREEERLEAIDGADVDDRHPLEGVLHNFLNELFQSTCESNDDCNRPQVCCDFGYKKMCCSSGKMARDMQLAYATVPVTVANN